MTALRRISHLGDWNDLIFFIKFYRHADSVNPDNGTRNINVRFSDPFRGFIKQGNTDVEINFRIDLKWTVGD